MTGLFVADRALVSGDSLFADGIARPDLQQGDPAGARAMGRMLYATLRNRVLTLADDVVLLPGHTHPGIHRAAIAPTLAAVRAAVPELAIDDPALFAEALLAEMPPRPANYETVIAANRRHPPLRPRAGDWRQQLLDPLTSTDGDRPMKLPSPIPIDLAEMIAARLRVIGDPNRIRILDQLRGGELSVAQITERLGTSQQNASKHLGVLLQAGIVARRKEGTSSYYSVADEGVFALCEQVCGGLHAQLAELTAMVEGTR
jgi:DNA-binding transcriptional ArsR family regulator